MQDDIILNKAESIKNCLNRIREDYEPSKKTFLTDYTRQDAVILNLQRAVQTSIDIAAHVVRAKRLDLPKETRDLFVTLHKANVISKKMKERMISMVGFRNVAIHEYTKLDMNIVVTVIESHLMDFEKFIQEILQTQ